MATTANITQERIVLKALDARCACIAEERCTTYAGAPNAFDRTVRDAVFALAPALIEAAKRGMVDSRGRGGSA